MGTPSCACEEIEMFCTEPGAWGISIVALRMGRAVAGATALEAISDSAIMCFEADDSVCSQSGKGNAFGKPGCC